MKLRILLWTMILTLSCSAPEKFAEKDQNSLSYATGFDIRNYSEFQQINIYNPWQKSQGESFSYFLTSNPESLPDSIRQKKIIKTPVKRVIVFSSTHVGFLAAIGKSSSIVGVSGKGFISDSTVLSSLENKKCLDIGFSPNIDFESILLLNPDLVFLYGLDPSVTSLVKRLEEAGIKSVLVSEYLEGHPLGKAEWIRFFSVFFECGSLGDSIYRQVERNYLALKDSADNSKEKPGVLVGLPWKDTWYMAGGKSFTAKFIEDAGGRYLWKDNTSSDYIPLDLESVFQKAVKADIWINTGSALNKTGVLSIDTRFQFVPTTSG
jgi:iron complex transport system substrate-binding protein